MGYLLNLVRRLLFDPKPSADEPPLNHKLLAIHMLEAETKIGKWNR